MKTVGTTLKAQGKPVNEAGERAKKKIDQKFYTRFRYHEII